MRGALLLAGLLATGSAGLPPVRDPDAREPDPEPEPPRPPTDEDRAPRRLAAAEAKRARKAARRLRERRGEADPLLPLLLGVAWVLLAALTPIGLAVVAAALAVPEVMP